MENGNRTIDMLRKKLKRSTTNKKADTPRTKTRKLLRHFGKVDSNVRKTLPFHYTIMQQIREKYRKSRQKRIICATIIGRITKKYKFNCLLRRELGVGCRVNRTRKRGTISTRLRKEVHAFFERDDNSRITTGVKQTITRNKVKRQKRLMLDTLRHLFSKYQSESNQVISFTTFFRLKPFWVKCPTEKDREICLCKTCENLGFMIKELFRNNVISTTSMDVLVEQVVCSTEHMNCMYGKCVTCKEKQIETKPFDQNLPITYSEWVTEKEKRELKSGVVKDVIITTKKDKEATLGDLIDRVHDELWLKYRKHSYNIKNQFSHYKTLRQTLKSTECFIHIDFSDNYVGKMSKEIQSKHFGASKVQMTLHTGYFVTGSMETIQSFCGVSDILQHDPISIWAFLRPVLQKIREQHPEVETLFFFSDGPTTQYRQKLNFYLFSTEIFELGFLKAYWNFHAAGHGKGIPDGI